MFIMFKSDLSLIFLFCNQSRLISVLACKLGQSKSKPVDMLLSLRLAEDWVIICSTAFQIPRLTTGP